MSSTPSALPSVTSLTLDSFRPETLDAAVTGGAIDHIQLGPGRFVGHLLHAELGDCVLDYGAYNLPLLACGGMPADRVVLGFVGSAVSDGNLNGRVVQDAAVVALAEGSELHYHLAPQTRWMGFQVARTTLEQLGAELGPQRATFPPLEPARRDQVARHVAASIETLRAIETQDPEIVNSRQAARALCEGLTASLVAAFPANDERAEATDHTWRRRTRIVRRTRDYFDANLAEPVRVTQLCRHVGASVKSIERAFVEICGTNPKQFLTLMRMARARRLLLAARGGETTVVDIATACGFFHLGRFSKGYSTLYGELPSATLLS
jgi:AraC-like DNA-binding protein